MFAKGSDIPQEPIPDKLLVSVKRNGRIANGTTRTIFEFPLVTSKTLIIPAMFVFVVGQNVGRQIAE